MQTKKATLSSDSLSFETIGKYRLDRLIGRGTMGTVWRATAPDGSVVAIKILAENLSTNEVALERLKREAGAAIRFQHPNLVRAIEIGSDHGRHFLVMEYVEGETLGDRLEREGRLLEEEALRIVFPVARALQRAHRKGLVHRDVKLDNIMINREGKVKLTDLGLVKDQSSNAELTKPGRGLGTPYYMPPEQFHDAKDANPSCDVYALGVTLYCLVTGELPFRAKSVREVLRQKMENAFRPPIDLNPELNEWVSDAICRAMDADPGHRPSTCLQLTQLLRRRNRPHLRTTGLRISRTDLSSLGKSAPGKDRGEEQSGAAEVVQTRPDFRHSNTMAERTPLETLRPLNLQKLESTSLSQAKAKSRRSGSRVMPSPALMAMAVIIGVLLALAYCWLYWGW